MFLNQYESFGAIESRRSTDRSSMYHEGIQQLIEYTISNKNIYTYSPVRNRKLSVYRPTAVVSSLSKKC